MIGQLLILNCILRVFLWPSNAVNVSNLIHTLVEISISFISLCCFFFIFWCHSGFTPPLPPTFRHYGKSPASLRCWRHLLIVPTVFQQRDLFLCHQTKALSLSPGKVKLSGPSGNQLFISVWLIHLWSVFTLTQSPFLFVSVHLKNTKTVTEHNLMRSLPDLMAQWFTNQLKTSRTHLMIWIILKLSLNVLSWSPGSCLFSLN